VANRSQVADRIPAHMEQPWLPSIPNSQGVKKLSSLENFQVVPVAEVVPGGFVIWVIFEAGVLRVPRLS